MFHRYPLPAILSILAIVFFVAVARSAPVSFVPVTLRQPDGRELRCFASGDEFYNWLHDKDGYTIMQDPSTGFYVYAAKSDGRLKPTDLRAGAADPAAAGLDPWLRMDGDQLSAMPFMKAGPGRGDPVIAAPTKGMFDNIVIFIRFKDEDEFKDSLSYYGKMYNAPSGNSLLSYYKEVSYNTLTIRTSFFPKTPDAMVLSYQDSLPRSYYKPYNEATNPDGYRTDSRAREENLLLRALDYVSGQVPDTLILDGDKDGFIDNVSFLISGEPTAWATLLWPHMTSLSSSFSINGARVRTYNFLIESFYRNGKGVEVVCHEMFHSLGAPDLYRYSNTGITPVGPWDIMANTLNPAQHMGAYMKWRYGKWIASIPEIRTPGAYTLSPVTSPTNNCYKIASPYSSTEYFVVEYRRKGTAFFDNTFPADGLLVYRINTLYRGNAGGPPDEVYIYRPDGTRTTSGNINAANFSSGAGRTQINDRTNPSSFLTDGKKGGLNIHSVGAAGATISFQVGLDTLMIQLTSPLAGAQWEVGSRKRINWITNGVARRIQVEYSTNDGAAWHVIASPATGPFYWTVPDSPSRHCRFRISDVSNPILRDSVNFSICPKFYRVLFNYDVTDSTEMTDNFGVSFVDGRFWTSRAGSDHCAEWSREGKLLNEFLLQGAMGIKAFTTDGKHLYAATGSDRIARIDIEEKKRIALIVGPMRAQFLTWDPTADGGNGGFWIGSPGSDIVQISTQGAELARIDSASLNDPNITGIAFDGHSPGGPYLWTFSRSALGKSQFLNRLRLPDGAPTGLFHDVLMDIGYTTADGLAGGLSISTEVIPGKAVLCGTLLGIPNRMFGYELPDLSPSLLFEENFPYPAEARLSDHGWAVDNGVSVQPVTTAGKGLFYTSYISSNIGFSALLRGGAGNRQDVVRPFAETRDVPVYAALLVRAIQLPSVPAPFLEILPATGADPAVLLFIRQAVGGGVQFGVGRSADPDAADYSGVVCPLDSTILVAFKHKASSAGSRDDTLALWVNPPLSLIEPPCDNIRNGMPQVAASVARLRLRQSGTTAFECLVDGIRIGGTWDEAVGRGSGIFSRSVLIVDATDEKQEPFKTLGVADSTVDAFYKAAFQSSADWDALELGPPRIDYMLRHQFVVWHSDHRGGESQPMIASQDVIDLLQQYMDAGGKLLIGGWRHLAWIDNGRPFPREFAPGSFAHDFLHIRVMDETAADTADFLRGEGRSGFSQVTLDPAKLPLTPYEGKLDLITLFPETADSAEVMFAYGNDMQSGRPDYRGKPVAIHSVTPTSDAFSFGFPLYFLPLDQASRLAREVLSRVGVTAVPLGADSAPQAACPEGFMLGQNYPNPFNPSTVIPFTLPERSYVMIEITDPLGRRVAILHEGELDAGTYTARWIPACASGMYFCSMTALRGALPAYRAVRKMVLAR